MLSHILTNLLEQRHRDAGMYVEEDEHFVYLKQAGQKTVVFSSVAVTPEELIKEANKRMIDVK